MGTISYLGKELVVKFYIDIGTTSTTLLDYDTLRLGVNWSVLPRAQECIGASGRTKPRFLCNPTIELPVKKDNNLSLEPFPLGEVNLIPPKISIFYFLFLFLDFSYIQKLITWWISTPLKYLPILGINSRFSLLGMDILKRFTVWNWDFKNKKLILDEF